MLKNVVDGFSYNTMLQMLPYRYFPQALGQMDILRRAANYRPRWFVFPDDISQPIVGFDTAYFQIEVAHGSYLWGLNWAVLNGEVTDLLVKIVDSCTGVPLSNDVVNGGGLHLNGTTRCSPVLLTQPRLILNPGLVDIEITNRVAASRTCQLLLHFAEPCMVLEETLTERGAQ